MALEKNASITIDCAKNGFFVRQAPDISRDRVTAISDMMVFQSQVELIAFLRDHFTFRSAAIAPDAPPKE